MKNNNKRKTGIELTLWAMRQTAPRGLNPTLIESDKREKLRRKAEKRDEE